jgi:hypothetical protein
MLLRVPPSANVRISGCQVSIHQPLRKLGGSVIHINIGVARIFGDGNLNRGRAAVLPIVQRIAMVVNRVIAVTEELAGSF